MRVRRMVTAGGFLLVVLLLAGVSQAQRSTNGPAAGYRLGPDDVLQLNVLQQPALDREVTIQPDSTIFIPQVGEMTIGGVTLDEAEQIILQRLRLYNPSIDSVALSVLQYNALRIHVIGGVVNPGTYTFDEQPSLWEVVRAAGGPAENANLAVARIIRETDGRPQVISVNLSRMLIAGDVPDVQLQRDDTLAIPLLPAGSTASGTSPALGVQVFGGVATPTTVPVSEPTRLVTVMMMAGAPTPDANLEKVWWVHTEEGMTIRSRLVDVSLYLERGSLAGNPLIYPGDTVRVEERRPGWLSQVWPIVLTTMATFATIYLIATDNR